MTDVSALKRMVSTFRVHELQNLLSYGGQNKHGKKSELLSRINSLLSRGAWASNMPIQIKITELHKKRVSEVPQNMDSLLSPATNLSLNSESMPVHPDVTFKVLPFYDVVTELLKPTSLNTVADSRIQEHNSIFHLTPAQCEKIKTSNEIGMNGRAVYTIQVQLRFALLETSCPQEDAFPPSICVQINGKIAELPAVIPTNKVGVEAKRPSRPVDITMLCRFNASASNNIFVSWASEYGRNFCFVVCLVRKLNSNILLDRLKAKGQKHPDHTRALIKEKLTAGDNEIATTSLRISLLCPLGMMRMRYPARPNTCSHLQCFDAATFLQMNEKKPTWNCPVCHLKADYDLLILDGLFAELCSTWPSTNHEVKFGEDGNIVKQSAEKQKIKEEKKDDSCVYFDDDDEDVADDDGKEKAEAAPKAAAPSEAGSSSQTKKIACVDLTETDDEDESAAATAATSTASVASVVSSSAAGNTDSSARIALAHTKESLNSKCYNWSNSLSYSTRSPPPPYTPTVPPQSTQHAYTGLDFLNYGALPISHDYYSSCSLPSTAGIASAAAAAARAAFQMESIPSSRRPVPVAGSSANTNQPASARRAQIVAAEHGRGRASQIRPKIPQRKAKKRHYYDSDDDEDEEEEEDDGNDDDDDDESSVQSDSSEEVMPSKTTARARALQNLRECRSAKQQQVEKKVRKNPSASTSKSQSSHQRSSRHHQAGRMSQPHKKSCISSSSGSSSESGLVAKNKHSISNTEFQVQNEKVSHCVHKNDSKSSITRVPHSQSTSQPSSVIDNATSQPATNSRLSTLRSSRQPSVVDYFTRSGKSSISQKAAAPSQGGGVDMSYSTRHGKGTSQPTSTFEDMLSLMNRGQTLPSSSYSSCPSYAASNGYSTASSLHGLGSQSSQELRTLFNLLGGYNNYGLPSQHLANAMLAPSDLTAYAAMYMGHQPSRK